MNTWNLITYDWKEGIWRRAVYFILPLIVALSSCISLHTSMMNAFTEIELGKGTFMDYWIYLVQGDKPYKFDIYSMYILPAKWLCFYIFLLVGLNNYPMNELQTKGYQILLHSKSRLRWWSSKAIWVVAFSAIYFAVSILTVTIYALANGSKFSLHASPGIMTSYAKATFAQCSVKYLFFTTLLLPFLFACFLGLMHLFLTNIIKPMHSLIILICILVISTYKRHWLLIGNLAMPFRMKPIQKHGIPPIPSFIILAMASIVMIVAGYWIFRKKDIFEKAE